MNMIPEQDLIELAKAKSIGWFIDDDDVNGGCKFTWAKYLELARAIEAMVKEVHSPPPLNEVAEVTYSRLLAGLLQRVIAYYEGRGEYNFSHLSNYDRDNAAFDAWQEIRQEIKAALRDYDAQKKQNKGGIMNFDLRKELQQSRDGDPVLGTPFTKEQEKRLQELIREGIFRALGAKSSAPRRRIGLDGEKDDFEKALKEAAKKVGAVRASDMQLQMQEASKEAANEIKQQIFARKLEEENEVEEPREKAPDTELSLAEWDVAGTKFEHCVDPLERKWTCSVRAEIQRKDRKPFDSVIGKFIKVLKNDMLFEIKQEKKRYFLNSDGSVSMAADILCVSRERKP